MLDVVMPEMSGTELSRRLRQANTDANILYLTGYADQLFHDRGALWEGEAYIEKPMSSNGLLEAVSLLIHGTIQNPPTGL